jgi:hypothetical protein
MSAVSMLTAVGRSSDPSGELVQVIAEGHAVHVLAGLEEPEAATDVTSKVLPPRTSPDPAIGAIHSSFVCEGGKCGKKKPIMAVGEIISIRPTSLVKKSPGACYSAFSALIGSTFVARLAGI